MARMPLIFVNGKPKAIENMRELEWKKFIQHLFLVIDETGDPLPEWWPPDISWLAFMWNMLTIAEYRRIVFNCYAYNNELYTLYLSDALAKMDFKQLEFRLIGANVTAIYNTLTDKIVLVTVNENIVSMIYLCFSSALMALFLQI